MVRELAGELEAEPNEPATLDRATELAEKYTAKFYKWHRVFDGDHQGSPTATSESPEREGLYSPVSGSAALEEPPGGWGGLKGTGPPKPGIDTDRYPFSKWKYSLWH